MIDRRLLHCAKILREVKKAKRASADDLADAVGLSVSYVEQLIAPMRLAGLLTSVRGPGGGYELKKENVTFEELLAADIKPFGWPAGKADFDDFETELRTALGPIRIT
jgi:predicted DNA-binding transcriptional regulator YafY